MAEELPAPAEAEAEDKKVVDPFEGFYLEQPMEISPTFQDTLARLAAHAVPGEHYLRSDDGTHLLAWKLSFPVMTEAEMVKAADDAAWNHVRAVRAPLLIASDERAFRYFKAGVAFPEEEIAYVQALRDVTKSSSDPRRVAWPDEPKLAKGI